LPAAADLPDFPDVTDMLLFAQVVEHGGYTAAARATGMQASKLSRRVAELEAQLGVRLLQRTTRSVTVTEIGQTLYRHCVALQSEARAAREAVERVRSAPQGVVRLSCPPGLLRSDVAAILSRYLAEHPLVRIDLVATNRRVNVVKEGFDIAIRVRRPPLDDSDLAVRPLGDSAMVLVASPRLLACYGHPATVAALAGLPTLGTARMADKHVWPLRGPGGTEVPFHHVPRLATDDMSTLLHAACDGAGVACLPHNFVQRALDEGALIRVLPEFRLPVGIVHAVFPSRRGLVPAVRTLLDALVRGFGTPAAGGREGDARAGAFR